MLPMQRAQVLSLVMALDPTCLAKSLHVTTKRFCIPCEAGLGFEWLQHSAVLDPRIHSPKINPDQVLQHGCGQRPAPTGPALQNQGAWCWGGGGILQDTVSPTSTCSQLLQMKVIPTHSHQVLVP